MGYFKHSGMIWVRFVFDGIFVFDCVASPFPMNSFADLDDLDAIKSAVWMSQRYM